ncbi:hypothetical protein MLD38_028706 [Melastoma candidum]|uniref:Uncharacterized protein n=1 Tax=Melastoma candidum TaxID=119954 RepID=A0ACB9N3E7_9MYRT|nr:hypothetical protein MLD38_028706 [Melastoma candidum]
MRALVFPKFDLKNNSHKRGLSQMLDEGIMARKVFAQKKHVHGLEAPRNSLDLQIEASDCCAVRDCTQFYGVNELVSGRMRNHPDALMKKLIRDEMSSRSTNINKQRSPSLVARLMGMDVFPVDSTSLMSTNIKEKESTRSDLLRRKNSISSGQGVCNTSYSEPGLNTEPNISKSDQKDDRPWRREHPQEDELQKFKKEFEAWQASRSRECSQFVNLDQIPSQPGLREKPSQAISLMKPSGRDFVAPWNGGHNLPMSSFENMYVDNVYATISGDKSYEFLHPTRIVILKPGPDNNIWSNNGSLTSSSGSDERGSSIEDFLHEVKERLRLELQGKVLKKSSYVRGSGIETPFREKPLYCNEEARNTSNRVGDSVDRDIEVDFQRSGSARSYRSEMYSTEPWSPEFIHRDTRRFMSERLRNVMKGERHSENPNEHFSGSTSHILNYHQWDEDARRRNYYPMNIDEEHEIHVRSFRNGSSNDISIHKELSPRNLMRSMSAPVSGTSFGKLLLEDRHVLTSAHIRRKQEACGNQLRDMKKTRREKFNFKEKVHNIKYTFTLRQRLFGKRIPSIKESRIREPDFFKDMLSGPTVLTNFGERFENSTEVPPSPASVCSSTQDEYWRPSSNLSPISTPDLSIAEEDAIPGVFREISLNLNELRRQLNQLGSGEPVDFPTEQWTSEPEMPELDDKVESYIRDLLVASGWYDGSPEVCLLKQDSLLKPIGDLAFKDVEECYRKSAKDNHDITENSREERLMKIDRKLLHDLINEVLPSVLSPAKSNNPCFASLVIPRGRDLLCTIWEIVRPLIYPKPDESHSSMETMTSWYIKSNPWMYLLEDKVAVLCRELEAFVVEELMEELLKEMGCESF